eukprot:3753527-Lingulodinium_polyedra.AAC.1
MTSAILAPRVVHPSAGQAMAASAPPPVLVQRARAGPSDRRTRQQAGGASAGGGPTWGRREGSPAPSRACEQANEQAS